MFAKRLDRLGSHGWPGGVIGLKIEIFKKIFFYNFFSKKIRFFLQATQGHSASILL